MLIKTISEIDAKSAICLVIAITLFDINTLSEISPENKLELLTHIDLSVSNG